MKILHNLFHPNLGTSFANKTISSTLKNEIEATFVEQYQEYPDFKINIEKEQQRLTDHDLIICQFPFYWYSCPSLMKKWLDEVFLYGFAYPPNLGNKLHNKSFLIITTTGGTEESYKSGGYNNFSMSELLRPFQQAAILCGMKWLSPFVIHSAMKGKATEDSVKSFAKQVSAFINSYNPNEERTLKPLNSPYISK